MSKWISLLIFLLAAAIACHFELRVLAQAESSRQDLVLTLSERSYNTANSASVERTQLLAFRRDGARAEVPLPEGRDYSIYASRLVIRPDQQIYSSVVDSLKIKTSVPLSPGSAAFYRSRPAASNCADPQEAPKQYLGEESRLGLIVHRFDRSETRPDGEIATFSLFRAPQLDCVPLKNIATWKKPDGTVSTDEKIVIKIERRSPDPSLFEIPSTYRELPPSEFDRTIAVATGRSTTQPPGYSRAAEQRDRRYSEAWQRAGRTPP